MESYTCSHQRCFLILLIGIIGGALLSYFVLKHNLIAKYFPHVKLTEPSAELVSKRFDLKDAMRILWTDHVTWTKEYIVAAVTQDGEKEVVAKRLLQNQDDIGAAIVPFYGKEAGNKLAELLRQHILQAADLVAAAMEKNTTKFKEIDKKWKQNATDIAQFLAKANHSWSETVLDSMLQKHLDYVTAIATAQIKKDWSSDITNTDENFHHMMQFADILADGVIKQFPDKF